jgi:hypothetical protein
MKNPHIPRQKNTGNGEGRKTISASDNERKNLLIGCIR